MQTKYVVTLLVLFIVVLAIASGIPGANAQMVIPKPEEVRFQMISHEPLAAPDGRSVVPAAGAQILKDRRTGLCYAIFSERAALAAVPIAC